MVGALAVGHHGPVWSTVVHVEYVLLLYVNGIWHWPLSPVSVKHWYANEQNEERKKREEEQRKKMKKEEEEEEDDDDDEDEEQEGKQK